MSVEVNSQGIDLELKRLAAANKKVLNKALKKAGQEMAIRLEQRTPYDPKTSTHLKTSVVIGNPDQAGNLKVGFDKKVSWRAHFVELGTIYQQPQGMIQRTQQEMENRVIQILKEEIQRGLGLS